MAEIPPNIVHQRYALITGANKGIGLGVCRQLASQGAFVVLTSRDAKRGIEAVDHLKQSGISSDNIEFHQLDVTDPTSVASLADFIKSKFGKLDILVNNAGIGGAVTDFDALVVVGFPDLQGSFGDMIKQTVELVEGCVQTNYFGAKRNIEALLPLLELSDSPRIVNVSSAYGKLSLIPSERIRAVLGNADNLTEEKIDEILNEFLRDFKDGSFVEKGWPANFSAYIISKASLNAYTRILTKKYPSIIVNCLCPGYVKTDINGNTGLLTVEEGASRVVRLASMPHGSPSGLYYIDNEVSPFE